MVLVWLFVDTVCMFKAMASCLVQGLCRLGLKQVYVTVGFRLDRLKGLDRLFGMALMQVRLEALTGLQDFVWLGALRLGLF